MKRILLIAIPLALFAGFLLIKPPALNAQNTTVVSKSDKATSAATTPSKPPVISKPNSGKSPVIAGENENEKNENEENEGGTVVKNKVKPKYNGHDDDDYDD
jgi:hypothetical protein